MAEPVRVYKVSRVYADISADAPKQSAVLSKPSVAVLPFANVSGDLEQEYFSDGITEDIIIDLSRVSRLNVLSRHTVFALKGRAVDVREIAQQLNVTHVVEGSVRKAGGRVRITAQLIEATKDVHIWAERYDHELNDIFAVQDEISQAIVTALKISLLPVEKTAIESRSTKNSEAYDLYLRARHYQVMFGVRNLEIALRFSQRALEVDPNYARAWALIAVCRAALHLRGRSEETGLSDAERALSLDPALAEAYAAKGRALAGLGRFDEALAAHEESLRLEPDSFEVRLNFGRTCLYLGRHEAAILHLERGAQLRETDYHCLSILASAYRAWGRLDECQYAARRALERLELEISLRPDNANALVNGVIALAYLGENQRAKEWASRALTIDPDDALDHYNLACAMVQINELDQALSLLESCSPRMPAVRVKWMMRDADLKPLHSLPRFQALIAAGEARLAALLDERAPGTA
jgi:adenylate cyclase